MRESKRFLKSSQYNLLLFFTYFPFFNFHTHLYLLYFSESKPVPIINNIASVLTYDIALLFTGLLSALISIIYCDYWIVYENELEDWCFTMYFSNVEISNLDLTKMLINCGKNLYNLISYLLTTTTSVTFSKLQVY